MKGDKFAERYRPTPTSFDRKYQRISRDLGQHMITTRTKERYCVCNKRRLENEILFAEIVFTGEFGD